MVTFFLLSIYESSSRDKDQHLLERRKVSESGDYDAETVGWLVSSQERLPLAVLKKISLLVKVSITRDQSGASAQLTKLNQNHAFRQTW